MSEKGSKNTSNERLQESLSAVMDGENSEFELHQILDGIHEDEQLRQRAERYQLIGDVIRGSNKGYEGIDISQGVMAAIADDQPPKAAVSNPDFEHQSSSTRKRSSTSRKFAIKPFLGRVWEPLAKVAMVACVALAVVMGVRSYAPDGESPVVADSGQDAVVDSFTEPVIDKGFQDMGIRAGSNSGVHHATSEQLTHVQGIANRAFHERFRAYALHHAELSATGSGQTVLSLSRLTSIETH